MDKLLQRLPIALAQKKIAVFALILAFIFCIVFVFFAVKTAKDTFSKTSQNLSIQKIEAKKIKIVEAVANETKIGEFAAKIKAEFPSLDVSKKGELLIISSKNAENYQDWITSIHLLPSLDKSFVFTAEEICIGKCENANSLFASIKASTFSVGITE